MIAAGVMSIRPLRPSPDGLRRLGAASPSPIVKPVRSAAPVRGLFVVGRDRPIALRALAGSGPRRGVAPARSGARFAASVGGCPGANRRSLVRVPLHEQAFARGAEGTLRSPMLSDAVKFFGLR